ncbi:MAG: hypothetical protein OEW42_15215 [Acidimicrobiia bacterium]|nr:hypothetical protein [Acidimicrobiia bacterium]
MSLDSLLRLHADDTTLEQLRHRREALPERAQLAEMAAEQSDLDAKVAALAAERDGLVREQKRLEDEVAMLEAKTEQEKGKLYGGSLTSPKEAQALQDELDSLHRHQTSLEDRIIGFMEQVEPLTISLESFEAARSGIGARRTEAEATVAAQEAEIDQELAVVTDDRAAAASRLDDELLRRYDAARASFGPSAVVEFDGKNCVGCPLTMPAVELDRVKKAEAGTLVDCRECGRLVVR